MRFRATSGLGSRLSARITVRAPCHTRPVHSIKIQAAADHLQRMIGKQPMVGLAELIWNSLDAEASHVAVSIDLTDAGAVDRVRVQDDGHGFVAEEVDGLFASVGGSWKEFQANRR